MSQSEQSEHKSENSFDKNVGHKIGNLHELFKRMGLEPYQFKPTKNIYKKITGTEQSYSKGKHLF